MKGACTLHLSRCHGDRWGATDIAEPSIRFCFQLFLGCCKTSTLSTQRYNSPNASFVGPFFSLLALDACAIL